MSLLPAQNPNAYHRKFTGMLMGTDGVERHFINGAYGRENDLPCVIHPDGSLLWYIENPKRGAIGQRAELLHRTGDQPAHITANDDQYWYFNGKLHREGGRPAIILADGTLKWFIEGNCMGFQLPGCERK